MFPSPQGYHIEKQVYERDALAGLEAEIDASLKKAGGANYDLGNQHAGVQAGNSNAIKAAVSMSERCTTGMTSDSVVQKGDALPAFNSLF